MRESFLLAITILLVGTLGCTTFEYEEEIVLDVDGSGTVRFSGSTEILEALHPIGTADLQALTSFFDAPGLDIDSVRETEKGARRFLHVQGSFTDWNSLCRHPAFRYRECRLEQTDDALVLHVSFTGPTTGVPEHVPSDGALALRFHFPSTVRFHNSATGIERGNIIRWERSAEEYFGGAHITADARFERRSVLATTALVLGTAIGAVFLTVLIALVWMVRIGRRQLAAERQSN